MGPTNKKKLVGIVGGVLAAGGLATAIAPAANAAAYAPASYDAAGSTTIGQGVNSTIPLGPSRLNVRLDLDTGNFDQGTLPLPPKQVNFRAYSVVPLRATVNFIQSGQITGNLSSDANNVARVTANAKYTIKLTNVQAQLFPFTPYVNLNVGANCQTVNPVSLNLKTPAGQSFDIINGGTVSGKYSIGQFQNCNVLFFPNGGSFIVNSVVPGANNSASIQLSNGSVG